MPGPVPGARAAEMDEAPRSMPCRASDSRNHKTAWKRPTNDRRSAVGTRPGSAKLKDGPHTGHSENRAVKAARCDPGNIKFKLYQTRRL